MTDNITKGFTDKECEILIKDIVTLVMMGYVIDDESNDINNAIKLKPIKRLRM